MCRQKSLCDNLGLELVLEENGKTAVITDRKDTMRVQVDSKTAQFNDETKTLSVAPVLKDETVYVRFVISASRSPGR